MSNKILVVDDETEIADLIEVYLKNENYTVFKFYTAQEALNCIETTPIDLAILDIMLPDIDGFILCKKIREHHTYPIIMLTAKDAETDKITGLTLGADDYITKPFRLRELIARIRVQIRRAKGNTPLPDTLTATERKLVQYLQINSGRVMTREQIFNWLWDQHGEYVEDITLSVHIRLLREKLDVDGVRHIRTVRGIGYQWIES